MLLAVVCGLAEMRHSPPFWDVSLMALLEVRHSDRRRLKQSSAALICVYCYFFVVQYYFYC